MEEIWKKVLGHPNYSVSNTGKIRNDKTGRILKPSMVNGYFYVALNKKKYKIHRLVATAFVENPKNLPYINHIDKNKTNNNANNLEWCTPQYNSEYSLGRKVLQLDSDGNVVKEWESVSKAAREFNVHHTIILGCCNNNTGFNWKYK